MACESEMEKKRIKEYMYSNVNLIPVGLCKETEENKEWCILSSIWS